MEDETKNEPTQQQEQTPEPQAKTYSEEDYKALQAKLDAVTGQLNDANSKIQSYTEMDIDGIKLPTGRRSTRLHRIRCSRWSTVPSWTSLWRSRAAGIRSMRTI